MSAWMGEWSCMHGPWTQITVVAQHLHTKLHTNGVDMNQCNSKPKVEVTPLLF